MKFDHTQTQDVLYVETHENRCLTTPGILVKLGSLNETIHQSRPETAISHSRKIIKFQDTPSRVDGFRNGTENKDDPVYK